MHDAASCHQRHQTDEQAVDRFNPHAVPEAFPHPPVFSRPAVLCHKGCDRAGNRLFGHARIVVHPSDHIKACHRIHAQGVHCTLDQDFSNRLAALLKRRNAAVMQCAQEQRAVRFPFIPADAQKRNAKPDIPDAQNGRQALGDDGGPGRCERTAVHDANKQHVKYHIEDGGKNQESQRCSAVPHAFERIGRGIVQEGERNAEKHNAQIPGRKRQNICGHRHQPEQWKRTEHAQKRQNQRHHRSADHGRRELLPQLLFVPGPIKLTHDHARPDAQAGNAEHQKIGHRSRSAHSSKRFLSDKPSDHHGVHGVVCQLKQVAQHQRNRISDQSARYRPLCHIDCCHLLHPPDIISAA